MTSYTAHCVYGYYGKDVRVTVDRWLENMPYAQAGIRDYMFDDGPYSVLVSYETDAAWIDGEGRLTVTGLYSMSTRKHIMAFVRQICRERGYAYIPSFNDIRRIAGQDRVIYLKSGFIYDKYNGFVQD